VIIDSSALIAIVRGEPEQAEFARLVERDPAPRLSAATLVECYLVAGPERAEEIDEAVQTGGIQVVPFDQSHARAAASGHARFGKGSGSRARLNLGDCFSYALAKVTGEPLLFKGDDFTHTDVTPAR
jgi:ribonuclease VapC